ncbi:MAG: hypothetical protein R6V73_03590 [Anaerolineales bacterium]
MPPAFTVRTMRISRCITNDLNRALTGVPGPLTVSKSQTTPAHSYGVDGPETFLICFKPVEGISPTCLPPHSARRLSEKLADYWSPR